MAVAAHAARDALGDAGGVAFYRCVQQEYARHMRRKHQ
jgi:hypothetical protein